MIKTPRTRFAVCISAGVHKIREMRRRAAGFSRKSRKIGHFPPSAAARVTQRA